jgi:hypothetical protein
MKSFRPGTLFRPLLLIALILTLAACAARVNTAYRAPIDADTIERATNSLAFDVQDFHWSYMRDGRGLKVVGLIKNNTGEIQRRAVVYALVFDEKGIGTAMGEAQVSPTVLKSGAVGKFTLVAATNRPKDEEPLRHLRLLTNTQAAATK